LNIFRTIKYLLIDTDSPYSVFTAPTKALKLFALMIAHELRVRVRLFHTRATSIMTCNVCGWHGRYMRTFFSREQTISNCICPQCGSFGRHRLLYEVIQRSNSYGKSDVSRRALTLSASSALIFALDQVFDGNIEYSEYDDRSGQGDDIRSLSHESNKYDLVVCVHVLEHVREIQACMSEIHRVLKPGGTAYIQVPFEPIDQSKVLADSGSHGHYWEFGRDYYNYLKHGNFKMNIINSELIFGRHGIEKHNIDIDEEVVLLIKGTKEAFAQDCNREIKAAY
jgi:SAM-dependent methyltransferase